MCRLLYLLAISLPLCSIPSLHARIIHVPGDSATIQGGIDGAIEGDTVMVAPGSYYEHDIDFLGKAITVMGTDPEDSAVVAATVVDADRTGRVFLFHSGEDTTSLLTGLSITGGQVSYDDGGGILCDSSSPTITNSIIGGNSALYGGGLAVYNDGNPTVTNCLFNQNSAAGDYGGGGGMSVRMFGGSTVRNCTFIGNSASDFGGGMFLSVFSGATIGNCTFIGNSATEGGGMYNSWSDPIVVNSAFVGNSASSNGGGMNNSFSFPTVTNCTFTGNTASNLGGGMYHSEESGPTTVSNCTFSGNSAMEGGGIYCSVWSDQTVTNCILWGNVGGEIVNSYGIMTVSYSDVQGGYSGKGNIDDDPLFGSFHGFDYLLKVGSPCVDAGDPSIEDGVSDWHPRWPDRYPNGPRSDMGAYGGPGNAGWLK